ncbi:hypothetical protein FACS1894125_3880 [Actinomycetota bacterium]|nr:hypothetical protein FACS1894125_3880 [Actinomycetota bacterium]
MYRVFGVGLAVVLVCAFTVGGFVVPKNSSAQVVEDNTFYDADGVTPMHLVENGLLETDAVEVRQFSVENEMNSKNLKRTKISVVPKFTTSADEIEGNVKSAQEQIGAKLDIDKPGDIDFYRDSHDFTPAIAYTSSRDLTQEDLDVLRNSGLYQSVDFEHYFKLFGATSYTNTPNDSNYNMQWGLRGYPGANFNQVWGSLGSASAAYGSVKIAVIDTGAFTDADNTTGVDNSLGNIIAGCDFGDGNASCSDTDVSPSSIVNTFTDRGHGVEVSSIIASSPNNGNMTTGAAYDTPTVVYKVAKSADGEIPTSALVTTMDYIRTNKTVSTSSAYNIKVVNLSLGDPDNDPALATAVTNLVNSGVTVVASAGNDGAAMNEYPAAYSNVISVGAIGNGGICSSPFGSSDAPAYFTTSNNQVNIAAAGYWVPTVVNIQSLAKGIGCGAGTSYSSPIVASAAALLLRFKPTLTPQDVMNALQFTAVDDATAPATCGKDNYTGYGVLDVKAAVDLVSSSNPPYTQDPNAVCPKEVYRVFNTVSGEHLWTADQNESNTLVRSGNWNFEGRAWVAFFSGQPLYRLFNIVTGEHLYTTDKNEVNVLSAQYDWNYEGIQWYGAVGNVSGVKPVNRLYNTVSGEHLLSQDQNEINTLVRNGDWNNEGVVFRAR